jgi:hypothetical protein
VPPSPVKLPEYVVDADGETAVDPLSATAPTVEMVPVVALEEVQVSVALFPCVIDVGFTEIVHAGSGRTVTLICDEIWKPAELVTRKYVVYCLPA